MQIPVGMMTMKQLKDTCKNYGLPTTGSRKDVLVKRIQENSIEAVFGYSGNEHIKVALSSSVLNELKALFFSENHQEEDLAARIKTRIKEKSSKWRLEMYVKHSDEFYRATSADGTCGFVMDYIMTNIRYHQSTEVKNSISLIDPVISFEDVPTRDALMVYALDIKKTFIRNKCNEDSTEIRDFHRRVDGFIDFLKNYRNSGDRLTDTSLWLSVRTLHMLSLIHI